MAYVDSTPCEEDEVILIDQAPVLLNDQLLNRYDEDQVLALLDACVWEKGLRHKDTSELHRCIQSCLPANGESVKFIAKMNAITHRQYDGSQLREMVAASARDKGADHADTINATTALIVWLTDAKLYEEALPLAQRELVFNQRMVGGEEEEVPRCMVNLANCLAGLGRNEEAEKYYTEALDTAQVARGHEHEITLRCCARLADHWVAMDKYEDAERLFRRMMDFNERLLGMGSDQTMQSIQMCGNCLTHIPDKVEEGLELLHAVVDLNTRIRGLDHHHTIHSMQVYAKALMYSPRKDYVQAESLFRQAVKHGSSVMGPEHPMTLNSTLGLCVLFTKIESDKLTAEARAMCRQCLELHLRVYGEEHADTLQCLCALANVLCHMRRFSEARPLARRALEACKRVLGPSHQSTKWADAMVQALAQAAKHPKQVAKGKYFIRIVWNQDGA